MVSRDGPLKYTAIPKAASGGNAVVSREGTLKYTASHRPPCDGFAVVSWNAAPMGSASSVHYLAEVRDMNLACAPLA